MHCKSTAKELVVDEYSMVHSGKIDAAISLTGATNVTLYGDARQIPYDPFCADFVCERSSIRGTVSDDQVVFIPKTHRLSERGCAAWVDQYPAIYPCDCCGSDAKDRAKFEWYRVENAGAIPVLDNTRFHAYKQDEKEEMRQVMGFVGDADALRKIKNGGLATVHEDQGTTHANVLSARVFADYDKNRSVYNSSLFNRVNYVLTDMTRAQGDYRYYTICPERDEIIRRVELANDISRIELVRKRQSLFEGCLSDIV